MRNWYYFCNDNNVLDDITAAAIASVLKESPKQFNVVYSSTIAKYLRGLDDVCLGHPDKSNGDEVTIVNLPYVAPFDILCNKIAEQLQILHYGCWKPYLGFVREENEIDRQLAKHDNLVLFCYYLNEREVTILSRLESAVREIESIDCTSICCGSHTEPLIKGAYDFRELIQVDEIIKNRARIKAIVTSAPLVKEIGCLLGIPVVYLYTHAFITYSNGQEYIASIYNDGDNKLSQTLKDICNETTLTGNYITKEYVKKKFEIPYNFDEEILPYYAHYSPFVNFLFLPPYCEDTINTRTGLQTDIKGRAYMPQSRAEYEYHINLIKSQELRFVVLWQDRKEIISKGMLDYYTNLGACGFIIANDENAKIIKEYNPKLIVISSIVQRLCKGIGLKDFQYYDYVVMFYPFTRSLDAIKSLSKIKDKIVIMPNSFCHTECQGVQHWFGDNLKHFDLVKHCPAFKDDTKSTFIYPEHLKLFDDYVGGYKLQGREWRTDYLVTVCESYFNRVTMPTLVDPFLDKVLKEMMQNTPLNTYYNSKTKDIIEEIFNHKV